MQPSTNSMLVGVLCTLRRTPARMALQERVNQRPISTFLGIAAAAVLAATGHAADINVPGDQATIQAGINAAVNGDVVIVAEGEYFENINFNGKAITVRSTDPDDPVVVMHTIINGTGFFHVVQCVSGEGPDTVLSGFVITGGNANTFPDDARGGGMFNDESSSPAVTNCSFSGNSAIIQGGGMGNLVNSSPTVTNCTFSGNSGSQGGGMYNADSTPTVANCSFSGNTALGPATHGGGMNNFNSSPTVTNCTFSGNSATTNGGGMSNSGGSSPTVARLTPASATTRPMRSVATLSPTAAATPCCTARLRLRTLTLPASPTSTATG